MLVMEGAYEVSRPEALGPSALPEFAGIISWGARDCGSAIFSIRTTKSTYKLWGYVHSLRDVYTLRTPNFGADFSIQCPLSFAPTIKGG